MYCFDSAVRQSRGRSARGLLGVALAMLALAPQVSQAGSGEPAPFDRPQQAVVSPGVDAGHAHLPDVSNLATLVEMAWARSPQARQLEGAAREAQTQAEAAGAWFPSAPTVSLGQRSGSRPGQRPLREQEVAVQAPLWQLGQRSASQRSAELAQAYAAAAVVAHRLVLTRQVRERVADLALADVRVRQARAHLADLEVLEAGVKQRVRAGDQAESDALLVRQDVLVAQADVRQAQLDQMEAEHAFHVLVGEARPPSEVSSERLDAMLPAISEAELSLSVDEIRQRLSQHPAMLAAQAAAEQQAVRQDLLRRTASAPWELGLQHRRDQEADVNRTTPSWGISVTIPLAADPDRRQAAVVAQTAADVAQAEARRLADQLETEWLEAQQGVRHQQAMLDHMQAASAAAQTRAHWIRKAYALGEMSLTERLRAELSWQQASTRVMQQRAWLAKARARLSYAQGAQ